MVFWDYVGMGDLSTEVSWCNRYVEMYVLRVNPFLYWFMMILLVTIDR